MNNKSFSTLSPKVPSEKRYTTILLLIILILAGISILGLISAKPSASTSLSNNSISLSNNAHLPGRDFGAINDSFDPESNKWGRRVPFVYTMNEQKVICRSELGPLTETVGEPSQKHGPGRDYGSNGSADYAYAPVDNSRTVFSYYVNGNLVVRKSELGPLTEYAEKTVISCVP